MEERKQMEEALRKSEEKFRNIFESANDCMVFLDRSGRILDVNGKAVEVFGGSKKELLGKHFTRVGVLSPRDIPMIMGAFAKALAGKKTTYDACIKNKKGREIHVEVSGSLMKMDGKVAGLLVIARDITERKRAEEALKESEQKLRGVIDTSPDAIVWVDTAGEITLVNRKVLEITGFSKEDFVGKNFMDVKALTQESKEKILEAFMERIEGMDTPPYEVEVVAKNGEVIPAELNASPIYGGGKIVGTQSIFRDLRERKKVEERIRGSEERLRQLIEYAPDAIYINDFDGNFVDGNKQAEKMIGYKKEELIGKNMLEVGLLPEKYVPKALEAREKTLHGQRFGPEEFELIRKDGSTVNVEISCFPMKRERKFEVINIARDTAERKKMEEKLRQYSEHLEELVQKRTEELLESEKRYSVLVEEASDGVVILQDGKIVFANKKAAPEIVGYSRDQLIGLPFEKLVDKNYLQYTIERYKRRLRGEKVPAIYEIELIAKNGERVPVEISATLIHYQGRPADLIVVRDVRERKRMEEERLKLEKLATIGELATMVGHDLRNPLQSIENATYYLNNELPRLSPSTPIPQKAIEMLQIINDSVNYADKIIRDLHDFSATNKPTLKKTNINTIVKETLSQVKAPENVELITELGHLPEIKADKDMIKRAFLNLAINGIQAMEKGRTLKVSTKKTKGFVEISFKDTGVGMSKENMEKLSTPFFTTKAKGMGMGLPICKRFIESHGGSIEVESEEGKGTTFTVKLPVRQDNGGEKSGEE